MVVDGDTLPDLHSATGVALLAPTRPHLASVEPAGAVYIRRAHLVEAGEGDSGPSLEFTAIAQGTDSSDVTITISASDVLGVWRNGEALPTSSWVHVEDGTIELTATVDRTDTKFVAVVAWP